MINLADIGNRLAIIQEIESEENKNRKRRSFAQYDIYKDNQHTYVYDYLRSQFSANTVNEMPIISSINLSRRIVNQEASVYKNEPKRKFYEVSEDQESALIELYEKAKVNSKLMKSNQMLKLQDQSLIYVVPSTEGLSIKVLLPHQYDVIPNAINPEIADGYVISTFQREFLGTARSVPVMNSPSGEAQGYQNTKFYNDGQNQKIADPDDYMENNRRYVVWTKELNFIMDSKGNVLSEDPTNPIGVLPFIDVFHDKDMEYFVRIGQAVTDFSIQFNAALSDLANVNRMQGWGQAYLKCDSRMIPENIVVGPNKIIKLPVDPNTQINPEFGFANANPDIAGAIKFIETLLAMFMSSRGVDPKTVTGQGDTAKFTSGIERLLSMVEKFEASKEDYSLFKGVEYKLFHIFKAYINTYSGTEMNIGWDAGVIPDAAYVECEYQKPEMVQTDQEKLATIQQRLELGLISKVEAIAQDRGISEDAAEEVMLEIKEETMEMDLELANVKPDSEDSMNGDQDQETESN
jgi:hypothetical protein